MMGYMNRSTIYAEMKKYREAKNDMDSVMQKEPMNSQAFIYRALCYHNLGAKDSARADLENADKLHNPQAQGYLKQFFGK
jgi:Tfp pilus assembly protein PilF